ncbi:unnamed protein product [Closterium sp. Yama58-4]|nr:unnamed protein product [Closterium sp. Yama58-4]
MCPAGSDVLMWTNQNAPVLFRLMSLSLKLFALDLVGLDMLMWTNQDAGVHALGNTCHVDIQRVPPFLPKELTRAINHFLQLSAVEASVVAAREVPLSFHARFQATERTYLYRIHASPSTPPSIFDRNRVWHVPCHLNVPAMRAAAAALCGFHDFSSFRASGCQARSPLRSLTELSILEVTSWRACLPASSHPSCTTWQAPAGAKGGEGATAPSFLYHQVRLLVGLLKAVGAGAVQPDSVKSIVEARDIRGVPPMAPACGLYLANVAYGPTRPKRASSSQQ